MSEALPGMSISEWYGMEASVLGRFIRQECLSQTRVEELHEEYLDALRLFQCFDHKEKLEKIHQTEFPEPFNDEKSTDYLNRVVNEVVLVGEP